MDITMQGSCWDGDKLLVELYGFLWVSYSMCLALSWLMAWNVWYALAILVLRFASMSNASFRSALINLAQRSMSLLFCSLWSKCSLRRPVLSITVFQISCGLAFRVAAQNLVQALAAIMIPLKAKVRFHNLIKAVAESLCPGWPAPSHQSVFRVLSMHAIC